MLSKKIRFFIAALMSVSPFIAAQAETESGSAETPEAAVPEMSEQELHEMLGFLTAMGGGVATLELDAAGVEQVADGLVRMLKGEVDLQSLPQEEVEQAFSDADARAQAVQDEAEELPTLSSGALEKIGMVMAVQSGLTQLGFGANEAEAIRAGFLEGADVTEPPAEVEAKMPAFQAYIQKRVAAAQADAEAEQAKADEAAMAEFKPIAEEWSQKENMNVVLETNQGDVTIELYPKEAPLAVANFVGHIENGYYDGLTFHRVIDGFMIQGGDPQGTGAGGESIWGKPFPDEFTESLRFDQTGLLAMANSGPTTNGSQFFITTGTPNWLNDKHTIFGKVVSGYENVKKIEQAETGARDKPVEDQVIVKAYVQD
ncbi:MAG: peptidylprolyl isomerase [Opitutales bacterium]